MPVERLTPMTKKTALVEAARRWGVRGEFGSSPQICLRTKKYMNRCLVGYLRWKDTSGIRCDSLIIGEGPTWEAAFANATERETAGLPPLQEIVRR